MIEVLDWQSPISPQQHRLDCFAVGKPFYALVQLPYIKVGSLVVVDEYFFQAVVIRQGTDADTIAPATSAPWPYQVLIFEECPQANSEKASEGITEAIAR